MFDTRYNKAPNTLYIKPKRVYRKTIRTNGEEGWGHWGEYEEKWEIAEVKTEVDEPLEYLKLYTPTTLEGTIYLVIVEYSDGDTFSHNKGNMEVVWCSPTRDRAEELAHAIEHEGWGEEFESWKGYFSGFESVAVKGFEL